MKKSTKKYELLVFVLALSIGLLIIFPHQAQAKLSACGESVYCGGLTWCMCGCVGWGDGTCTCTDYAGGGCSAGYGDDISYCWC